MKNNDIKSVQIVRRSVDARKRHGKGIKLVYNVHVELNDMKKEASVLTSKDSSIVKLAKEYVPYKPTLTNTVHSHPNPHPNPNATGSTSDSTLSNNHRPIVVGSGPGGLFAAYTLVCSGYKPIIIEMGPHVERRSKDIMQFWKHDILTPNSNGVFGEGGAGAFSDGKLTTRTSSPYHRFVHDTLIKYGAKDNILVESRAHVGTDQLRKIITNFSRDGISAAGATFLYCTELKHIHRVDDAITHIEVHVNPLVNEEEVDEFKGAYQDLLSSNSIMESSGSDDSDDSGDNKGDTSIHDPTPSTNHTHPQSFKIHASQVFLATGHSARSVFQSLYEDGVQLSQKDFAIGLRLQISQKYINTLQYGSEMLQKQLGPAEFTLKHYDTETDKSIYTFCMCPGGVIVNASHGGGEVAINGMSYSTRASRYANAAFVVNVNSTDFRYKDGFEEGLGLGEEEDGCYSNSDTPADHPLIGMHFQQYWEKQCYKAGGGGYGVPAQRVTDYLYHHPNPNSNNNPSNTTRIRTKPTHPTKSSGASDESLPDHIMGKLKYANLHGVLPAHINTSIVNALKHFSKKIPQIIHEDTLLVGIETRTSSPVRIDRHPDTLESMNTSGLYPVGDGAGYAGGIMTACVDGVRAVEAMIAKTQGSSNDMFASESESKSKSKHQFTDNIIPSW